MPSLLATLATKAEVTLVRGTRLRDKLLTALKQEREKNSALLTYLQMQTAGVRQGATVDRQSVEPLREDCEGARQTVERLTKALGAEQGRLGQSLHRLAVLLDRLAKAGGSHAPYQSLRAALRKLVRQMK